jgi:hypothetical protein
MDLAEDSSPSGGAPPLSLPGPSSLANVSPYAQVEEKLYVEATEILSDTFAAREVKPDTEVPPAEWLERMTPAQAEQKLLIARAGWLPMKESPAFVQTARAFAVGRMKSEASKRAGNRTLNVQYVTMNVPQQEYEEIVVGRDK